jgi:hypothetical protein
MIIDIRGDHRSFKDILAPVENRKHFVQRPEDEDLLRRLESNDDKNATWSGQVHHGGSQ